MAKAGAIKFCTYSEIISSLAKGMTNHPQDGGGWAHVTDFACAPVDLDKFLTARR